MKNFILYVIEGENFKKYQTNDFKSDRLIIGKSDSDILIGSNKISRNHMKIKIENNKLYFADLDSTNGTFIYTNSKFSRLTKMRYYKKEKDDVVLRLSDNIMVILTEENNKSEYIKFPIVNEVSIGRNSECNIVLNHIAVSRNHANISKTEKGTLFSVFGTNGAFVNGKRVKKPILMKNFDVINILNFTLLYDNDYIYYKKETSGAGLEVHHLTKAVKNKNSKKKIILNDVSCKIESNDFVAIIGGSGAGKTTLMDAISGFDEKLSGGTVYFNGVNLLENFESLKGIIGYVPQQDIIYENLTLRRMLRYAIKLKSLDDLTSKEIEERIDKVLELVELTEHQNTYIRKLSGGQKKRASIAVELLGDPDLFFLDEPTSGLDPGTEAHLMHSLQKLSKEQSKTIIMVTHTIQNLDLCDKVIFMGAGGRICFCGSVEEAKMFFDTDSLIDIYQKINDESEIWSEQYKKCFEFTDEVESQPIERKEKRKVNYLKQFGVLTMRYAELIKNDFTRFVLLIVQPVIMGILMYFVSSREVYDYYENSKSIFFVMSCAAIWLGVFNSIQEICKERVILRREYMGNLKIPVYILSKYVMQIVIGFAQSIIMLLTFSLTLGLPDIKPFIFSSVFEDILLILFMTILSSSALGLVISSFVKSNDRAMAIAPFALIIQLLFSGILFELDGFTEFLSYFTISRWSMEGFGNIMDLNNMALVIQKTFPSIPHEAEAMFIHTEEHYWMSIIMMFLIMIFMTLISIISLRNISKNQR